MKTLPLYAALALLSILPAAQAHVGLEPKMATAGAYQKLVFRVGHGCEGSATTGITIVLPEPVAASAVKAMPKPGWTLNAGGKEISWKGSVLPDAQFDEFNLLVKLPDAAGSQVWKVLQQCEKGRAEWSELPGAGGKFPAPVLEVMPAGAMPAMHH
jgi:periplasmic copper chaperone A